MHTGTVMEIENTAVAILHFRMRAYLLLLYVLSVQQHVHYLSNSSGSSDCPI